MTIPSAQSSTPILLLVALMITIAGCTREANVSEPVPVEEADLPGQAGSLDMAFIRVALHVPEFSGLYFDEQHVLHVLLVGDASHTATREAVADAIVRASLLDRSEIDRTQMVLAPSKTPYTWFDLDNFKDGMRDVLALPDVTFLDADEVEGVVTIGIAKQDANAKVQEFADRAGLPKDAWRTVLSPYRDRYLDLSEEFRPMVGGIQIKNDAGTLSFFGISSTCTLSVVGERSGVGVTGFVTNSHCTRSEGGVEGTRFFQSGRLPFNIDYVAHESADPAWTLLPGCPTGSLCRSSDSAFAVIDIGNQNGVMASIARPSMFCTGSCPGGLSSPTARITLTGTAPAPIVGSALTKVGRSSGWTGGLVTRTCATTRQTGTSFAVLCQTDFAGFSAPGDSGSPILAHPIVGLPPTGGPLPTTATLSGILWGGNGVVSTFSPIAAVVSELAPLSLFPPPANTAPPTSGGSSGSSGLTACQKACRNGRDGCMRDVAGAHGPRPQQCVAELRECYADCRR